MSVGVGDLRSMYFKIFREGFVVQEMESRTSIKKGRKTR